jgi:homogentisate 1,2-dioxygenase
MFESSLIYRPTRLALETKLRQPDYLACWQGLKPQFRAP